MHIITIAFACSQIQYKIVTISIYLFSEHASFFFEKLSVSNTNLKIIMQNIICSFACLYALVQNL